MPASKPSEETCMPIGYNAVCLKATMQYANRLQCIKSTLLHQSYIYSNCLMIHTHMMMSDRGTATAQHFAASVAAAPKSDPPYAQSHRQILHFAYTVRITHTGCDLRMGPRGEVATHTVCTASVFAQHTPDDERQGHGHRPALCRLNSCCPSIRAARGPAVAAQEGRGREPPCREKDGQGIRNGQGKVQADAGMRACACVGVHLPMAPLVPEQTSKRGINTLQCLSSPIQKSDKYTAVSKLTNPEEWQIHCSI